MGRPPHVDFPWSSFLGISKGQRFCKGVSGGQGAQQRNSVTAAAGHRETQEACSSFIQVPGMRPQPFFPREEREADESILSEDGHVLNFGTYKDTTSLYNS